MAHELNKQVVSNFNVQVIQNGRRDVFEALMADDFVNHSAPAGMPNGPMSMWNTFDQVLRPALAGLTVTIHDQIAEGDKVMTRKTISGVHVGPFMGIPATGKPVAIDVIDVVRVSDGRYVEHWGLNTLTAALNQLRQS